jgi:hypothetical protein
VSESLGLPATNPSRYAIAGRWPAVATTFAVGALIFTAAGDDGFVLCPYRRCTGGYCPGCGGTRAVRNLAQGNISGAWTHNPWVVLMAVQAVVVGVALAFVAAPRRGPRRRAIAMPLLAINTVMLIAIWIVRLHNDAIPTGWL